jgi:hypothetical protein
MKISIGKEMLGGDTFFDSLSSILTSSKKSSNHILAVRRAIVRLRGKFFPALIPSKLIENL